MPNIEPFEIFETKNTFSNSKTIELNAVNKHFPSRILDHTFYGDQLTYNDVDQFQTNVSIYPSFDSNQ